MERLVIILATILMSTAIFILFVVKGGLNRKYLYTDNFFLGLTASFLAVIIYSSLHYPLWVTTPFISGFVVVVLFLGLFFFRFFRNPHRTIPGKSNDIVSGADGRIIYIKELEANQIPVTVKKLRIANINEITKTDILVQPCYLIGIAMTLFDVHINRAPVDGKIIFIKHTEGTAIGLNSPSSTIANERNTIVIQRDDGVMVGIVQIAARFVRRCIVSAHEGDIVKRGDIIGKIRWGSQVDIIIPRNCTIFIREGEQVYAGKTVIAHYDGAL